MDGCTQELIEEKIRILNDYVTKSEEILSNIETWENLAGIVEERDHLIKKLQEIEERLVQNDLEKIYEQGQKDKINDLIKLILAMDQDAVKMIKKEQKKNLDDLKVNQKHQKIANYEINLQPTYGTYLDVKK
ncbi:MAG: hypothetical protein CVV00_13655 [Firmicutes bacterium HGW-Firmicutes-5]|jgi:hypothetical protein|nr:MAG: hypothetical protein CVV00_13655 [Firmicutes bacterium HGW-Firmicutes-5]